jgi:hypothetical protein
MTDPNLTYLYFLLDRSGSMESIKSDTQGGFDAFIGEQRSTPGECRVTLAQFDDDYEEVYRDVPVADVPPLQLHPRGTTALLDSIGRLIGDAGARLAALPEEDRPGTVIVGIMTDGQENASREMTHARVKALIEQQTNEYNWRFLYMGADQDAIEVGASIGVAAANSMTYGRGRVAAMMRMTSGNISRTRAAAARGADRAELDALLTYSEEQRGEAQE